MPETMEIPNPPKLTYLVAHPRLFRGGKAPMHEEPPKHLPTATDIHVYSSENESSAVHKALQIVTYFQSLQRWRSSYPDGIQYEHQRRGSFGCKLTLQVGRAAGISEQDSPACSGLPSNSLRDNKNFLQSETFEISLGRGQSAVFCHWRCQ